jgi:hypothetical protein
MTATKASGGDYRRMLWAVLAACAALPIGWIVKLVRPHEVLFPDFFALWSFGRYVLSLDPASLYDHASLHAFQVDLGLPPEQNYPFLYPPLILSALVPLGMLPYAVARGGWMVVTFGAYLAALTPWRWPRLVLALLLIAPSTALCLFVGQTGFVTAALMLGGIRLLRTRPIVAGMLVGCLVCKPQFALMVPFVLMFGRHWRALIGAGLAVAILAAVTTLGFGLGIWEAWLASMQQQAGALTAGNEQLHEKMPTITSAVLLLGGGLRAAHLAQAVGALAGVLAIWRVRACANAEALLVVLPLATLLATPYAFGYDLPVLTGGVLAVIAARMAINAPFGQAEFPLLVACIVMPTVMSAQLGAVAAIAPPIFAATLWVMCRWIVRRSDAGALVAAA